jgi:hypothetical protein
LADTNSSVVITPTPSPKPQRQLISFPKITAKTFGDTPFSLSATAPGGEVTYSSASSKIAINGNQVTILGAGVAAITATQNGGAGYLAAKPVSRSIVINKSPQTVTMGDLGAVSYGSGAISLSGSSSSGAAVVFTSSNPKVARVLSGNTLSVVGAGSSVITASVPVSSNYLAASAKRTFVVTKAPQTISQFASVRDITLGGTPVISIPSSSSNLPVKLSVASGPAKYVKGKLRISGTGTITIVATQAGNAKYLAAPAVSVSFQVNPQ